MPEPKKPLITRERYHQYKRNQSTKTMSDAKKDVPSAKAVERTAPVPEKITEQPAAAAESSNKPKSGKSKPKLFRKSDKPSSATKAQRLTDKERGRKLDNYLNKAIVIVILLIILVFAIAFVL